MIGFLRPLRSARGLRRELNGIRHNSTESQTATAEKLMKRFWKTVSITQNSDSLYGINLDRRSLKTPDGKVLLMDKSKLLVALTIADEWENQLQVLRPHALPMTSLMARAIDGLGDSKTKAGVVTKLLKYLDTDTICFHEEFPKSLVKLQNERWKPLIAWVEETYDVKIKIYDGILGNKQDAHTILKLGSVVSKYDQYKLAAFERAVMASKSYLIALAVVEGKLTANEAANASHVEVDSQIERWGEVEDTHDVDHQDIRVRLGSAALLARS